MPKTVRTADLEIGYNEFGDATGKPVIMLHGFPDDAHTYDESATALAGKGFRLFAPFQRGYGATRFLDEKAVRIGQQSALAQDAIDFADAIGLEKFLLVGHDWGAIATYLASNLYPERVLGAIVMDVGYTGGQMTELSYEQMHAYWYQWLFNFWKGEERLTNDRENLCRFIWKLWSPSWKFDESTFAKTARSWENPDFVAITLHSYRHRWNNAPGSPHYDELMEKVRANPNISVPTLVLHGDEDRASLVSSSENQESFFSGFYERRVLPGVGHFVPREAPQEVIKAVEYLSEKLNLFS